MLAGLLIALASVSNAVARPNGRLLPPDGEPVYARIDANVARHGWACVFVADDEGKAGWADTVGLSAKNVPELLIDSNDDEDAQCAMLNLVARKLIAHHARVPDGYKPLGPKAVRLNKVYSNEFFDRCVLAGVWAIRHHTTGTLLGMQIVFPDEHGRFPD
ncbi:MAG: hypothetical protein JWM87_1107 [Candidatus Eremiobacteraeota bacterium]|nr:hypothetical protein [Candidatus Eremiobacteraeota bacterium]